MFFAMRIECATKLANKNDIFADYKKNHIFFVSLNHNTIFQKVISAKLLTKTSLLPHQYSLSVGLYSGSL
jgi:hypothetical protein